MKGARSRGEWKHILSGPLDIPKLLAEELEAARDGEVGALALFIGVVKSRSKDGKAVAELFLEAYEELADSTLSKICHELAEKYGLRRVNIVHSVGALKPGDPIVLVAIHARSRREAFEALQEAVRRYKTEPPLFKKEVYVDGSSKWIEENLGSTKG